MIYVLSYYVMLPLMMVVVPSLMLACMFCRGCEERRKQAAADERQLRVARELRHASFTHVHASHIVLIKRGWGSRDVKHGHG